MAVIETLYSIGDKVWHASTVTEKRSHPCPDCNGTSKWKAVSPAGLEYDFSCPRCATSYQSNRDLSLNYSAFSPIARCLTIGSVQHNSHTGAHDSGNRYMCMETGVGSGTIYGEDWLFQTEDEALAAAKVMADKQNKTTDWVVQLYNKTLDLSDYQLDNALIQSAKRAASRAGSMLWNLSGLFDEISEADDKDAILELVDDYKRRSWESDKKGALEVAA